jgi:hypothetical protein
MSTLSRRAFLAGSLALAGGARVHAAGETPTRLILLGTGGGPRPGTCES